MVKVLTPHQSSPVTPPQRGEGGNLLTARGSVSPGSPFGLHLFLGLGAASYLAFFDTTWQGCWGASLQPRKGESLASHLAFPVEGGAFTVLSVWSRMITVLSFFSC